MEPGATRTKIRKIVILALLGAAILGGGGTALFTYATLHINYSEGHRVGFVQKLSKRGWVCRTNEGELAMVNVAGQQAQMFFFTVPADAVAAKIDGLSGHRVELNYEEHKGVPFSCFGDTTYFVTDVRKTD
jgi:hypothetical protein